MRAKGEIITIFILTQLLVCIPVNILVDSNQLQQVAGSTNTITEISQFDDNYGNFLGLNVTNEIVAVSTYRGGVLFLNHSLKTLEVVNIYHNITTSDVAIVEDTAYVINRNGITALDISDLSNIIELDTFNQDGGKSNLEISNNCAYYIYNDKEIVILNISKPNNIQLISVYQNTKDIGSFKVKQNYIYGEGEKTFFIVNITNKSIPEEIDSILYFVEDEIYSFELEDKFAYLFYINLDKIIVLNCTNPGDIIFYKEILLHGITDGFTLKDEKAYFLKKDDITYDRRIEIYNYSDLNSVFSLTNFTSDSVNQYGTNELLLFESELYFTSSMSIDILDCKNITNIQMSGSFRAGGYSSDILVEGNKIFVADNRDGLEVIDIENISKPWKIIQSNHIYCSQLVKYQNFAFFIDGGQAIKVVQITENNEIIDWENIDSYYILYSLELMFPYLYVTTSSGIKIFYVGDLENPIEVGEYFEAKQYLDIKIVDDLAYVITTDYDTNYLKIFNIGTRSEPVLINSYEIINATGCLEINGDLAFVGVDGGVEILEISKPTNIETVSSFVDEEYYTTLSLHCTGNYLCIGSYDGITILDISNKKVPVEVASYYDGGYAWSITSRDNYIFVADGIDNLEILETSFSLTDSSGSKILVYILVPIGAVGVITTGIVVVIKIRRKGKMET